MSPFRADSLFGRGAGSDSYSYGYSVILAWGLTLTVAQIPPLDPAWRIVMLVLSLVPWGIIVVQTARTAWKWRLRDRVPIAWGFVFLIGLDFLIEGLAVAHALGLLGAL